MKARLPENIYKAIRNTIKKGAPLDPSIADVVAATMREWAMEHGATHFTHWFQPMTGLTAEKHDSFLAPTGGRNGGRRIHRQGARSRRARCLELSVRRYPNHLRGPRLYRLGPDQPGLHSRQSQRHHPLYPHGILLVDRRGPRQEDPPAPLDGSTLQTCLAHPPALRLRRVPRLRHRRPRARILPDRQELLLRPARPDQRRPDPVRGQASQGPGNGGPLFRGHPGTRPRLHARDRDRALQAGRAGQDPAQRGFARPVRDGRHV